MDAISFLEIRTIKNKLKNLLQAKYVLIIAFVLFTFASDLFSDERLVINNSNLLIAIYFFLIIGLWLLGFTYFSFTKTFSISNADKNFIMLSPIKTLDICTHEFKKKGIFIGCANVLSVAYFILYFCTENITGIPWMISVAMLSTISEFNIFYLLYSAIVRKKNIRLLIRIVVIIFGAIFLSFIWGYIGEYDFTTNQIERIIGTLNSFKAKFLMISIGFCLFTFVLKAFGKRIMDGVARKDIINTQLDLETSYKEYKEKNISNMCKKTYVEMNRNRSFQIKHLVIAFFGFILAILCIGLCETFGAKYGTVIACIFLLVYAILSGFIFGLDIFETETKKHYIHLIPETPIVKFIKISIPYLINQFVIGILMIGIIDLFNAYNINSTLLAATHLCFLILSLVSELIFFWIYKNENSSEGLLTFINGVIKLVVFTPSLTAIVATFIFPISQGFTLAVLSAVNIAIVLTIIRVSSKVLR